MSFYDDDAAPADDTAALRAELAQLRAEVAEVRGEAKARAAVNEAQLAEQIGQAQSPEQVIELVAAANRTALTSLVGPEIAQEVDV